MSDALCPVALERAAQAVLSGVRRSPRIRFSRGEEILPGYIAEVDIRYSAVSDAYDEAKRTGEKVIDILVRQRKAVEL